MPRAKLADIRDHYTTRTAADALGLSPYLIKALIRDGVFPPPSRVSTGGVLLLNDAWMQAAREAMARTGQRPRRRARRSARAVRTPSPEAVLGYRMGAARQLSDWPEIVGYFETLAAASDRVTVEELGRSTQDNPYIVVAVSAPENLTPEARTRNRALLGQLADPRGLAEDEVEPIIAVAKTVAIILAAQHADEIGAALMTLELAHDLAIGEDRTTSELLANTITLLIPSGNPDGIRMIVEWYRRWLGTEYEGCDLPWLSHPYVGHDNNRDWFMLTQAENRLYAALHNREHPQVVLDMHQTERDGARFVVPPFTDPLDPNQDPVIQQGFAALGSAIAARLTAAGKAGVATHIIFNSFSPALAYGNYHGSIDLLSKAASCRLATPVEFRADNLKGDAGFDPKVRTWNHPLPWPGGTWTLREIVEYDKLAARACLEHVAKHREQWLWDYFGIMRRTVERTEPPYAYVFPVDQRDPVAVAELLQTLERGAVEIEEATAPLVADGVTYPAGTPLVRLGQPAGAFAKTLLEVQQYPDLRWWPGGPPRPPYDIAGHTLPIQMGVRAVQAQAPFAGEPKLRRVEWVETPRGRVVGGGRFGYAFAPTRNRATVAINRLLAAGYRVHRTMASVPELGLPPGSALVPVAEGLCALMPDLAASTGMDIIGVDDPLPTQTFEQVAARLGVYQSWVPNTDEGWARWVLEEYETPYQTLHNADIRQGDLAARFDAILLPHQSMEEMLEGKKERNEYQEPYPPEYVGGLGDVGMEALRAFVEAGGTLIALDGACEAVIKRFALPVRNVLEGLANTDFYCPGSLLRVVMDSAHPLGFGLPRETAIVFFNSAAFELAEAGDGTVVARYPTSNPKLSGWLLGHHHLEGKAALVDVPLGRGQVVIVGFRPHFRAQARATYKVLFNAIARAGSRVGQLEVGLGEGGKH